MENTVNEILEKIRLINLKYNELTEQIMDPNVIADNKLFKKVVKERSSIEDVANAYLDLDKLVKDKASCEEDLKNEQDNELRSMFQDEIYNLDKKINDLVEEVKIMLLPKDENDDNNVIIEIRAAAGGEESALFCLELTRMYQRYAEKRRWKVEVLDTSETEIGGIKEITFMIKGKGAYSRLKFESGVHRVQRVPETESQGRIHTSTSTVAVLPEVEDIDFEILDTDLKIDTYRSGGAGGQHVNKTESAIRITHMPTGMVVTCQDERSQLKNKEKAMNILKSKLYDFYKQQRDEEYDKDRKTQVGSGNRNERIRTYNYPQGRVSDHRINLTSYNLEGVLNGDIDMFIDALIIKDREEKIANS